MPSLPDNAIHRLRTAVEWPDFSATKYQVIGEIGRGGMGVVYAAQDRELDRRVALKVLHFADESGEARILAQLEHPGIVPVHDSGILPDGRLFYAMKLVDGRRLDAFAATDHPLAERLRLLVKICEPVAFAHARGILHRDLKPENVMVGPFGEVLVMDWGVARQLAGGAEQEGTIVGTPAYMAPEQAAGRMADIDERSDVYGLGAILRFLLQGEPAPKPLEAICRKAMHVDRAERYRGAAELAADVARFLDGLPVSAYRETVLERSSRFLRRHQATVLLILAYLLMRAVLIFFVRR